MKGCPAAPLMCVGCLCAHQITWPYHSASYIYVTINEWVWLDLEIRHQLMYVTGNEWGWILTMERMLRNPYFPRMFFCYDLENFHLFHDEMHGMNSMDDKCSGKLLLPSVNFFFFFCRRFGESR